MNNVLITGGAKGMGGTIAELFAHEGATLALAARSVADLDAEAARIREGLPTLESMSIGVDVTNADSCQAMAQAVLDRYGRIDVLVCNAGGFFDLPFQLDDFLFDQLQKFIEDFTKGAHVHTYLPHGLIRVLQG